MNHYPHLNWTPNDNVYTTRQPCEVRNELAEVEQALSLLKLERHDSPALITAMIQRLTTEAVINPEKRGELIIAKQKLEASIGHARKVEAAQAKLKVLAKELDASLENELQHTLVDLQGQIEEVKGEIVSHAKSVCRLFKTYCKLIRKHNAYGRSQLKRDAIEFNFSWMLPQGWLKTDTSELIKTGQLRWLNNESESEESDHG